jgi:hypothetical protein
MKNNSSIFVIVISLFIIIFIIISYFVLSNSMFKSKIPSVNYIDESTYDSGSTYEEENNSNEPYYVNETAGIEGSNNVSFLANNGLAEYINTDYGNEEALPERESSSGEVFHLRDNIYNYDDAKAACNAYNSRLATLKEVINSYKNGSNWCNYGWSQGQLALYPTQTKYWKKLQEKTSTKHNCGAPGVNGGYFHNPYFEIGANCYGGRPQEPKASRFISDAPTDLELRTKDFKDLIDANKLKVAPFSDSKWSK